MDLVYAVNMLAVPAVLMFFVGLAMLAVEVVPKLGPRWGLAADKLGGVSGLLSGRRVREMALRGFGQIQLLLEARIESILGKTANIAR